MFYFTGASDCISEIPNVYFCPMFRAGSHEIQWMSKKNSSVHKDIHSFVSSRKDSRELAAFTSFHVNEFSGPGR